MMRPLVMLPTQTSAPLNAPTGLIATAQPGPSVLLQWTYVEGTVFTDGFRIERSVNGGPFTLFATTAPVIDAATGAANYTDFTTAPGVQYSYRVSSFNSAGSTLPSASVTLITPTTAPPAAPSNFVATLANPPPGITLTWVNNTAVATALTIQRATDPAFTVGLTIIPLATTATTYTDTTAVAGTTYYYRIAASNASGSSAWISTVYGIPAAPTGLTATLQLATATAAQQVNLNWTDNAGNEAGFRIERATGTSLVFTAVGTVGANITTYSDLNVAGNTTYTYRVIAFNPVGDSAASNTATVKTRSSVPAALVNTPADGAILTSGNVTFTWSQVAGATQYGLWVGSNPNTYDLHAAFETGTSRTITVPTDGKTIYVKLWSQINGTWSSTAYSFTAATATASKITVPVNNTVLPGANVAFYWDTGVAVADRGLWVGSQPGTYDLCAYFVKGQNQMVTLPNDGRTLYVRLWSLINGVWQSADSTYTASGTAAQAAQMSSPANGSTLTSSVLAMTWTAGGTASQYALWVGSTPNGYDLYAAFETGTSRTITVPANGAPLYVTLWSSVNGTWQSQRYTYTASLTP